MKPERSSRDILRQAILEKMPLPEGRQRNPANETLQVFDFAIQTFSPISGAPEKGLEKMFGEKLGMDGESISVELKRLAISTWDELSEERRKHFPKPLVKRVKQFRASLSE